MVIQRPLLKQVYVVFISYQLIVTYGIIMGYSAFLVPQLTDDNSGFIEMNESAAQWIGSAGVLLRPIGAISSAFLADYIGRKYSMIIPFLALTVSWVSIAISNNVTQLIITRLINGLFAGQVTGTLVYISEITAGKYCSMYLSLCSISQALGIIVANIVMYFLSWRDSAIIFAGYSFACSVLLLLIPESPQWYLMQNRRIDAEKSLNWFGILTSEQVDQFLDDTEKNIQCKSSVKDKIRYFLQPSVYKNFIIFCSLITFVRLGGYLVISNYTVDLFNEVQTIIDSRKLSVIFSWTIFLHSAILILLTTRVKLRSLNIFCSIGMIFTALISTTFLIMLKLSHYHVMPKYIVVTDSVVDAVQLLLILMVFLYVAFLYIGVGEIIFIIAPQFFPTTVRSSIYGTIEFYDTLIESLISYLFPIVMYRNIILLFTIFTVSSIFILPLAIKLPKEY